MTDRNIKLLQAARAMFTRYGFSKTTMADIAAEAGVARQTVYNSYARKEDILRAVVRLTGEETLEAVKAAWRGATTVEDKLTAYLRHGPMAWFEAMRAAPDWADLIEGVNAAASAELDLMEQTLRAEISDMLRDHDPSGQITEDTRNSVAEFFYSASHHAKHGATDADHLWQRLEVIREATVALLEKRQADPAD